MTSLPPSYGVCFVDFETRSRCDLKLVGGRRYAEHQSTEVVCAVLRSPAGDMLEWAPGDCDPWQGDEAGAVCANNAMNFDRHIWRKLGWPEPGRWIDTAELAKVAGYASASLEYLASELLCVEKDMQGNAITLALSKPEQYYGAEAMDLTEAKATWRKFHPKGCGERLPTAQLKAARVRRLDGLWDRTLDIPRPVPAPIPADILERVIAYCRLDVEIMAELYDGFLAQWLDSDIPGLEQADRALNDRGICFDRELARLLLDADAALGEQALEAAGVPRSAIASPAQLRGALAALGVDLPDAQADTLTAALATAPEAAQRLIRARQVTASIAAGKLRAGLLRCSPDGKLRDNRTYMGAHTGRFAGKGMQLDNLAKGI